MNNNYILTILLLIGSLSFAQENALHFDGANDVVDLTNNSIFDITNSITLEAWIYPTFFTAESNIITKFGDAANDDSYILRLINGEPNIYIKIGAMWYFADDNTALSLNTWHYISGVYDGTVLKIFVDGVLKNTVNQIGAINLSFSTVKIGRWLGDPTSFSGNIDEVRIWNIARSDAEITSNYNAALAGNETGLVAYYRFNQGIANGNNPTETSLTDLSSNNATGALSNFNLSGTTSNWVAGIDFSALSISENNFNPKEKRLYPNPANDMVTFLDETIKTIEVFDINGRMVLSNSANSISVKTLSKGVYVVRGINSNNSIVTKKLIKK